MPQPRTLQLGASEVLNDVLPVRRIVVFAQVGLELATEDLERSALANTVCSHETEHVARAGHGQAMELEAVRRVAVGNLALEVRGQVDDGDSPERALLGADAASYAETLGDEGESRLGGDLYAELAAADDRAGLLALLSAFLGIVSHELKASVGQAVVTERTFGLHCHFPNLLASVWHGDYARRGWRGICRGRDEGIPCRY